MTGHENSWGKVIDTEWADICLAVFSGPAAWEDWIELGMREP
jgi:hypothetical protein